MDFNSLAGKVLGNNINKLGAREEKRKKRSIVLNVLKLILKAAK